MDIGFYRAGSPDVGQRCDHAEEFFTRGHDMLWIFTQMIEGFGMLGEVGDDP